MTDPITWKGYQVLEIWNDQLGDRWKNGVQEAQISYKEFHPMPWHEVLMIAYAKALQMPRLEGASCTYHDQVLHAHLLEHFVMLGRGRYAGGTVGRNDSAEPGIGQDSNHRVCWFMVQHNALGTAEIWFMDSTRDVAHSEWYYQIRDGDGDFFSLRM